jgi:hypothetical protein
VFNIDGQAVVWKIDRTKEISPEYYDKEAGYLTAAQGPGIYLKRE